MIISHFIFPQAKGKIVVFDQGYINYPQSVQYRDYAAKEAAMVGGVASLVRSIASFSIHSPHTGWQVRIGICQIKVCEGLA